LDVLARTLIGLSHSGRRGAYGGSIVYSHAFDHPEMALAYAGMLGTSPVKPDIRVIAWNGERDVAKGFANAVRHVWSASG
jgi:hypothetical protein